MVLLSLKMFNSYQKKNKNQAIISPLSIISKMGQCGTLQWKKLNGLGKVCRILWSKKKGNKEWWLTLFSVPLWASFYWSLLESIYWASWRFYWLGNPVVFSPAEITTIQKSGWWCSAPTFQGTEEKTQEILVKHCGFLQWEKWQWHFLQYATG